MSDFYSREPVASWRIIFYSIVATVGVAAVGYYQNDHSLYIFAGIAGVFIGGFGLLLSRARASVKPTQAALGQPARFPRWVYWMVWSGLAASAALRLWDVSHKR